MRNLTLLCCVFFHLTVQAHCSYQKGEDSAQHLRRTKDDTHRQFANLLQRVLDVNQVRFDALKELTRLQDATVSSYLRARDDSNLEARERMPRIFIILNGRALPRKVLSKLAKMTSQGPPDSSSSETSSNEMSSSNEEFIEDLTRICSRRSEIFCVKEATKRCKKSCNSAYKNACLRYRCPRSMKSSAKRNCKRTCKKEFNRRKYDDSSSD